MNHHQADNGINQEAAKEPTADNKQYNSKQFKRIRVLGKGSFGVASVNRRLHDHSLVVLKEIHLSRFKGERERLAAINEARIMSNLNHVNIIKYYNAYTSDTKLIIEMEFASIGTLAQFLSFRIDPLEEQEILVIFRQITSGLSYLHSRNIIHLDLKITNIFVTIEGLIKIGDFGIAQNLHNNPTTQHDNQINNFHQNNQRHKHNNNVPNVNKPTMTTNTSHLGTLAYSSPERCIGGETSFKSDIWSLGCILYELITSKPLFGAESLSELLINITRVQYNPIERQVSAGLKQTFERMIVRDPIERPSAESLLKIIDQLLIRLQQLKEQQNSIFHKAQLNNRRGDRFDLSTEMSQFHNLQHLKGNEENLNSFTNQINYPHSLVYQANLGSSNIHLDRVNLPPTKRIKKIIKGKSHYLVLTYDNIVYGWGSKSHGQLGSCGLTLSTATSGGLSNLKNRQSNSIKSTRSSFNGRDSISSESTREIKKSLASSSQTINIRSEINSSPIQNNKQIIHQALAESKPTTRPFVINELNNKKIIQLAAGNNFSVFLSKTGIVMTCGDGSTGCLGRGDLRSTFIPCMVESLLNTDVVSIAAGPEHVVVVCGNGRAFSWGKNRHGRLGIGQCSKESSKFISIPQQVKLINDFSKQNNSTSQLLINHDYFGDDEVFIRNVYCGDKSTIFIDSHGRCWACGDNKFNKLGLDIKRRFKKTLMVEQTSIPIQIFALAKYKIINCNIGKNHSSFLTSEGKLIVFGQDIDFTYQLKESIICSEDSQRRISRQLKPFNNLYQSKLSRPINKVSLSSSTNLIDISSTLKIPQRKQLKSYRQLMQSLMAHKQLINFKQSSDSVRSCQVSPSSSSTVPPPSMKYNLNRKQRDQIELFIKKSRSMKKMPFDCVISVCSMPKFTLVLSNDNRVYFWGTRSYRRSEEELYTTLLLYDGAVRVGGDLNFNLTKTNLQTKSVEPQLVASCSDDCFIKIGATNSSLMSNIQLLGSDQPIIHAQDPRLRAQSLADLWIIDYKPSPSSSSLSSLSSASSSSSSESKSNLNSSSSSCSLCSYCDNNEEQYKLSDIAEKYTKHDAILEPQPIVSLYVPSMFNHNGCSLHLVDMFCFDEDRFYLILDTTVKMPVNQSNKLPANLPKQTQKTISIAGSTSNRSRINSIAGSMKINDSMNTISEKRAQGSVPLSQPQMIVVESITNNELQVGNEGVENQVLSIKSSSMNEEEINNDDNEMKKFESSDDNNNLETISSAQVKIPEVMGHTTGCSQCGGSIEEPRSLSTFIASQVIMSPTMGAAASRDVEEPFKTLKFNSNGESQLEDNPLEVDEASGKNIVGWKNMQQRRRRHRLSTNKSESTTITGNEFDDTSSMPSWVKNEFIQQQQQQQQASSSAELDHQEALAGSEPLFPADSSTTEDTCVSELSVTSQCDGSPTGSSCTVNSKTLEQHTAKLSVNLKENCQLRRVNGFEENLQVQVNFSAKKSEEERSLPQVRSALDLRLESEIIKSANRKNSVCNNQHDEAFVSSSKNISDCKVYQGISRGYELDDNHNNVQLYIDTKLPQSNAASNNPLIEPSPMVQRLKKSGNGLVGYSELIEDAWFQPARQDKGYFAEEERGTRNRQSIISSTTNTTVVLPQGRRFYPNGNSNLLSKSEAHLSIKTESRNDFQKTNQNDNVLNGALSSSNGAKNLPNRNKQKSTSASSSSLSALRNSILGKLFC